MTIYLMVKTHQKTGLKYLCKTTRNPFKYKGSGVDWCKHLKKYGYEHDTEIVMECANQNELYHWGSYYSKLWNVVNGQDDYGNKIWANRIPETGGGGATMTSEKASSIHQQNPNSRIKRTNTLAVPEINANFRKALVRGKNNPSTRARFREINSGSNNPNYDNTIYTFIHKTGITEICTQFDLRKKYNLSQGSLGNVVRGARKTHKGWRIATP
jgi:hypothetical protein